MAVSLDEKVALAGELGLTRQQQIWEAQHEAELLTQMSYEFASRDAIMARLRKHLLQHPASRWRYLAACLPLCLGATLFSAIVGCIVGGLLAVVGVETGIIPSPVSIGEAFSKIGPLSTGLCATAGAFVAAGVQLTTFPEPWSLRAMPLSLWATPLPYGALLAVKEAKARGLSCFSIYYPEERASDPVITGKRNGAEVIIFSWDEGLPVREQRS